jgi:GH35 family endo-1,4-beta-xylanase
MTIGTVVAVILVAWLAAPAWGADEGTLSNEAINARIQKLRTAEATVLVTGADGQPLRKTAVVVTMQRHKFLFGCSFGCSGILWGDERKDPQLEADYRRRFAELLNYATLPFYWGSYEPVQGQTREARLRAMAEWCRQQGIRAKGHPLVCEAWAKWQEGLDVETLRRLQLARVDREVKTFAGLIDTWDVVNEAVVMPTMNNPIGRLCKEMGAVELISAAFAVAHKTNPKAMLLLNDYRNGEDFVALVRRCLETKVPLDVIGVQSHMHGGYLGTKGLWDICERLAPLGKPLHWTEATIVSGRLKTSTENGKDWASTPAGEKQQAEQVAEFYRVLFSHPAVEAITWWDLSDYNSWMGAPAGLLRKDMSPKPAYDALKKLIKGDWWTGPLKLTTDDTGHVKFRGFLGDYQLRAGQSVAAFRLDHPGQAVVTATADAKAGAEQK